MPSEGLIGMPSNVRSRKQKAVEMNCVLTWAYGQCTQKPLCFALFHFMCVVLVHGQRLALDAFLDGTANYLLSHILSLNTGLSMSAPRDILPLPLEGRDYRKTTTPSWFL